ncbi:PWWP domain-containing DNA repair factor 3A [Rhynochetos jubatus]
MRDQEYVLCTWKKRLWPAKVKQICKRGKVCGYDLEMDETGVLCKTAVAGQTSVPNAKEAALGVEILGLKEQICVDSAGVVLLKKEHIEDIASNLDQNNNPCDAVEELKYRCSLKIALDILNQNGQVPPSEEGLDTQVSQENSAGCQSSTPLHRSQSCTVSVEKLEPESSKKRRRETNNPGLKTDTKHSNQKGPLVLEENAKARESGPKPSACGAGHSHDTWNAESQNWKIPESKSLERQEKAEPGLSTKSKPGKKVSLKPQKEKTKQGRKTPGSAGSPAARGNDLPEDEARPPAEEGSPRSVPRKPDAAAPVRRANARNQPRGTLQGSSRRSASDDLEKRISSESESLAKQLGARKKPAGFKRVNGDPGVGAALPSLPKRRCQNGPGASSGPSSHEMLSGGFPAPRQEDEENTLISQVAVDKVKLFQLPDFEEDEELELSDLSSHIVSSENLSRISALVDKEEEEEELPSILSHQEPQAMEAGILVWCKLRRYPYWPAVVKSVKRKCKKACVLLIEGDTNDKKKGFSVSLKNLKHFDCEEKQDLINRAKVDYCQEIEWCIRLISDYRIRVGCRSFMGSFLEYLAADISYPVRKESYQGVVQMAFPNLPEEDPRGSLSEASPQKPSKKLLPDRTRAARDKANKKIVDFIVKTKGAEEHLLAVLKNRKQSRWLKKFLNSSQYVTCIETYLEDEEQLDLVVNYLKEVYREIDTKTLQKINGDGITFISDVLLPEAIIYAISAVDDIDYKKAEEKYIKGPSVSKREREIFDEEILERKKLKTKEASPGSA